MDHTFVTDISQQALVKTEIAGVYDQRTYPLMSYFTAAEAVAANTTGIHAAVADTGSQQVITTGFSDPPTARTVTITATGTAGDVKAVGHPIEGYDKAGNFQSETVGPFTVNTLGTIESTKAYSRLTKHTQPAHDGTGVSFSVGWGNGLGLNQKFPRNTYKHCHLNNARESSAPTVSFSSSALGLNWIKLNTALDGHEVHAYFDAP